MSRENILKHLYILYDPEDGLNYFDTEQDALQHARSISIEYLDGDGWSEDVEGIYVAKVIHRGRLKDAGEFFEFEMTPCRDEASATLEAENAALRDENAKLREELAKSRLTWSDEEPTEEGWYWVESTTGVSRMMEYFRGIYATGIYSITACTPDGKPRRNCRIPEPQEPSE